jgi:hypothetical protein
MLPPFLQKGYFLTLMDLSGKGVFHVREYDRQAFYGDLLW